MELKDINTLLIEKADVKLAIHIKEKLKPIRSFAGNEFITLSKTNNFTFKIDKEKGIVKTSFKYLFHAMEKELNKIKQNKFRQDEINGFMIEVKKLKNNIDNLYNNMNNY